MSHSEFGFFVSIVLLIYLVFTYLSYERLEHWDRVYYPPLYDIKEKERRERLARERKMERELEMEISRIKAQKLREKE
ncbi:hypothetical protein D3C87_2073500 [compost metagenome]